MFRLDCWNVFAEYKYQARCCESVSGGQTKQFLRFSFPLSTVSIMLTTEIIGFNTYMVRYVLVPFKKIIVTKVHNIMDSPPIPKDNVDFLKKFGGERDLMTSSTPYLNWENSEMKKLCHKKSLVGYFLLLPPIDF